MYRSHGLFSEIVAENKEWSWEKYAWKWKSKVQKHELKNSKKYRGFRFGRYMTLKLFVPLETIAWLEQAPTKPQTKKNCQFKFI